MKKVLSLVLALALVLSLCVSASAEEKVTLSFFDKNSGTRTFDDPVALVGNDESKLLGMAPNRLLKDANGTPYDILCGPFFICGLGKEDFTSLSPELIDKYTKMFEKEMLLPVKAKKQNKQKER